MAGIERVREIRRLRKRRKKTRNLIERAKKGTMEKAEVIRFQNNHEKWIAVVGFAIYFQVGPWFSTVRSGVI